MARVLLVAAIVLAALAMRHAMVSPPRHFRHPPLPFLAIRMGPRSLRFVRLMTRIPTRSGHGLTSREELVPGSPAARVLVIAPDTSVLSASDRPGVLYLHGGGMVAGSPRQEAASSGRFARALGAVVVSPDYRLAPEHPFPAALDDCMATLCWMREQAYRLGIDGDRIAVIGVSAGGGLAAAVAQRAYDEGIVLRGQVLIYPMLDDRTTLRGGSGDRGRFVWTPQDNLYGWTSYLGRPPRLVDAPQYAAPARRHDLSGLAPAWVGVGDRDLFYEEAVDYAQRLSAGGVETELVEVPGMCHGADVFASKHPDMRAFRASSERYLRAYL